MRAVAKSAIVALALSCGGVAPPVHGEAPAEECALRLAAGAEPPELGAPTPSREIPVSRLVVHGEGPLSTLGDGLERRIQRRLAEGRFRIGPGGTVTYSVERSALALSVAKNTLVVRMPVQARAEACRGSNCYASCEPQAVVQAQVSLLLKPDYGFEPAKVTLQFTRGCKVKALGGLLTLDVTPTLEAQLEPELAKVAAQIDQQLTNLRADTEGLWKQLSQVHELPLGGCLVLAPQGIVQGPLDDSDTVVHARFAVLARPELWTSCGEQPPPPSLPPLGRDLSLGNQGKVLLGMVTPLDGLERAWASAAAVDVGGRDVRVTRAKLTPLGAELGAELGLGGEVCGSVTLRASPDFAGDGQFVALGRPRWLAGEGERLAQRDVNAAAALQALAALPRVTPPLSVTAFRDAVPSLVRTLSTKHVAFSAQVASARGAGAALRGQQLVAWLEAQGSLHVKALSAP